MNKPDEYGASMATWRLGIGGGTSNAWRARAPTLAVAVNNFVTTKKTRSRSFQPTMSLPAKN
jgi:hypothetical protein